MQHPDTCSTANFGVATYTSDAGGTLTAWSARAGRLLQIPACDALGRSCHEVVAGHDPFGNLYCGPDCPIRQMARKRLCVAPFRLDVVDTAGEYLPFRLSIAVVEKGSGRDPSLVHFLEPVYGHNNLSLGYADHAGSRSPSIRRAEKLTLREVEVLEMIATGTATRECAAALGISSTTVRNHVQSCLRKLSAHNRIEAVRHAERLGLLNGIRRS